MCPVKPLKVRVTSSDPIVVSISRRTPSPPAIILLEFSLKLSAVVSAVKGVAGLKSIIEVCVGLEPIFLGVGLL